MKDLSVPLAFTDFVQLASHNEVDSSIDTIEIGPTTKLIFHNMITNPFYLYSLLHFDL